MKKKIEIFLGITTLCLSLFSCNTHTDIPSKPVNNNNSEYILTPESFGEIHNNTLTQLINRNKNKQISNIDEFINLNIEIVRQELKRYDIECNLTQEDSVYINTILRTFNKKVIENKNNALEYLISVSNYPTNVKKDIKELVFSHRGFENFILGINKLKDQQSRSLSQSTIYSLEILEAISKASNDFWNSQTISRTSYGTYLADALGGATVSITGVGFIAGALTASGASYLWEKAFEYE